MAHDSQQLGRSRGTVLAADILKQALVLVTRECKSLNISAGVERFVAREINHPSLPWTREFLGCITFGSKAEKSPVKGDLLVPLPQQSADVPISTGHAS